jgi:peptide/nickel transport system substrate-binding protein
VLVRRRLTGVLVTSVLVAAPFAVTGQAQAQGPVTMRAGVTQDLDSLNPFITITRVGTDLTRLTYEYLTTYDPKDYHPVPGLAEKWETSPDKLTWTFTIRSGAKWSDGQPVTAKDAAFTLNTMMTNKTAATANGNFVQGWDSVTAPDDRTLVIKTKEPRSTMLALDIPIVPEHVWSKVTDFKADRPRRWWATGRSSSTPTSPASSSSSRPTRTTGAAPRRSTSSTSCTTRTSTPRSRP